MYTCCSATQLVADKHANVIFIANDSSFFKSLPDSLFRTMLLKDPQESTHVTVDEMVAHDVMGLYILQDSVRKKRAWTSEQAWYFVQALTHNNQIEYNKVLLDPLFLSGGENAMQHLQQAGLISIVMHGNGRPASIKLGKENYREAFKMLTDDVALKDKMDLQTCIVRKDIEGEKIARIEEELSKIAKLKALPVRRQEYLLERVSESQEKIDKFEEKIGELKKKLLENGKAEDSVGWRHRIAEAYRS